MNLETFHYDNKIVRNFAWATTIWGIVGMLVGLIIATQLFYPSLNLEFNFPNLTYFIFRAVGLVIFSVLLYNKVNKGNKIVKLVGILGSLSFLATILTPLILYIFETPIPFLVFSRLRPLHTNAVIFAFVGNGIFMGIYYSLQRLCKARIYSDLLSKLHFWGWQLIIVSAALTIPLGYTTGKEYAELEWPIDLAIAVVWIIFGIQLFGTIIKRRERHMYVAIWFYIATFITITLLHVVNSIELPVSFLKSYPVYAGVQDALVQWWYGHNAVAFFLTTPYLGLMYYYLPKAANRPIFSYRLSIIHFWALIFLYIWAGPHHLLYSALPDWAQSLGTVFSVMLIAPSWGGMLNGLLTLRGAWDKVRDDVVLKFMVVAITAYGMATFEGPMLSIKSINALSHFTDWTVAHVHVGALGWNGFLTFSVLYWLIPKLYNTELYSKRLANAHFWLGFIGILVWVIPMYFAGITQSLMWKEFTPDGYLAYPNFLQTVTQIVPMYVIRAVGGLLFFTGICMMFFNLIKTMTSGKLLAEEKAEAPALEKEYTGPKETSHRWLERKPIQFLLLSFVAVFIGGAIEMIPTFMIKSNIPTIESVKPYTPLELEGRDIYIREGCYNCHSQLIRPFRSETERYGEYSKAGEYVYDHPFQWGSKRTGPDLHRIGKKYPDAWHYDHMNNPEKMSPGSIMPPYPWLIEDSYDVNDMPAKIRGMTTLGVPYPKDYDQQCIEDMVKQAETIVATLKESKIDVTGDKEIIALIAYLQRLGTDIKATNQTGN